METNNRLQMCSVNYSRRLQTGISEFTSIFRNQTNSCECDKSRCFKFRGKKFVRKSSNRTCTFCRATPKFLQYLFLGSEKVRRATSCDKFETPHSVPQNSAFQDGHNENGSKPSKERRLGYFNRPKRCLFSCVNPSKTPKISSLPHSGKSLSIPSIGLRSKNLAKGVHQGGSSGHSRSSFENAEHKISSVSRRLASPECNKKVTSQGQRNHSQSLFLTRVLSKCRKIKSGTNSKYHIYRRKVLSRQGNCHANSRQDGKVKKGNFSSDGKRSVCKAVLTNSASDGLLYRNNTKWKTIHETNTTSPLALVETSVQRSRVCISKISASGGTPELVVTGSQHCQGQIFVSKSSQQNNCHRCVHSRVGRKLRHPDRARHLVRGTERISHKLSGAGGSSLDFTELSSSVEKSVCFSKIGQHNSDSIYLLTGRDWASSVMLQSMGTSAIGNQKQHSFESSSHSWQTQCIARPVEQNSDKTHRMDSKQCSTETNLSDFGETHDQFLCVISEQEDGSPSSRCRCFFSDVESNVRVCIPAHLPGSQSFGTYEAGTLSSHSDSATMAKKTLVSGTVTTVHCRTSQTAGDSQSPESTKFNNISSRSQSIQSEYMAAINRQLLARGFSQRARNLLSVSWRAGTQKDYCGKFKQFSSWCSGKQIDLYSASLTDCTEFLTFLFHKGLQYRTVAGYQSVLSSVLPPVNNIPVGQHPYIVRLLKGIFNSRPPTIKLLPEWELPLVLELLKKPPFEPLPLAPLKYLTWKSLFLVAITTFRRASDIQALKLGPGNVSIQNRGITFIRQGLSVR